MLCCAGARSPNDIVVLFCSLLPLLVVWSRFFFQCLLAYYVAANCDDVNMGNWLDLWADKFGVMFIAAIDPSRSFSFNSDPFSYWPLALLAWECIPMACLPIMSCSKFCSKHDLLSGVPGCMPGYDPFGTCLKPQLGISIE